MASAVPYGIGFSADAFRDGKAWAEAYARDNGYSSDSFFEHTVVWSEMDTYSHVNNANYARLFDASRLTWNTYVTNLVSAEQKDGAMTASVITDQHIHFLWPASWPDVLLCALRLGPFDEKRFALEGVILSYRERKVICTSTSGNRAWDLSKFRVRLHHHWPILDAFTNIIEDQKTGKSSKL